MSKIDTSTWQEFRLGDLFKIEGAEKRFNANSVTVYDKPVKGSHPYVVRTSQNNGVRGWIIADEKYLLPGNTLSFGQDTATVFYQEEDYFTGDKIKGMKPLGFEMTPQIACFMLANIRKAFSGFAWGQTSFNEAVLNNMTILLPVKEEDVIDYEYMEERIRKLEEERIRKLDAYLEVSKLSSTTLSDSEKVLLSRDISYYEFIIGDLFKKADIRKKDNFDKRSDTSTQRSEEYNLPLVNAKTGDNGIMYYGRSAEWESVEMSIDIVQNGAVATGDVYAQPQATGVMWDAYLIQPLYQDVTENILLFLATALRKSIKMKFGYDNKATWDKVKLEKVMLPSFDGEQPDFDFMDRYIAAQKKLAIQSVNAWRKKEIEIAEKLIKTDDDE